MPRTSPENGPSYRPIWLLPVGVHVRAAFGQPGRRAAGRGDGVQLPRPFRRRGLAEDQLRAIGAVARVSLHAAVIGDHAVLHAVGVDRADVCFGLVDQRLAARRPVRLAGPLLVIHLARRAAVGGDDVDRIAVVTELGKRDAGAIRTPGRAGALVPVFGADDFFLLRGKVPRQKFTAAAQDDSAAIRRPAALVAVADPLGIAPIASHLP